MKLATSLGGHELRSPLVGASGTVGSVVELASVARLDPYGACVAKSVAPTPWKGRPAPRVASTGPSMLNSIGVQNPGIEAWVREVVPQLDSLDVEVWGSAVGHTVGEFAEVAAAYDTQDSLPAIEVNLACPNLDHQMFALDRDLSAKVISEVRAVTQKPIGAKLSPNSEDIVAVADAVLDAGADWVVLTNTAWGFGLDLETRRPLLTGGVGGYSGVGLKALALRCVWQVRQALGEDAPILGCGGVRTGEDVVEYLMAGASAVAMGSIHFAEPKAAGRIAKELIRWMRKHGESDVRALIGSAQPW